MTRYKNSYRILHYTGNTCDVVSTINSEIYDIYKLASKAVTHIPMSITFHGNGYVKTMSIHNDYELYKFIRNDYKNRLIV